MGSPESLDRARSRRKGVACGLFVCLGLASCLIAAPAPGGLAQDPSATTNPEPILGEPTPAALRAIRKLRHTLIDRDTQDVVKALEEVSKHPGAEFFGLDAVLGPIHFSGYPANAE